jgi:hypothetical protein
LWFPRGSDWDKPQANGDSNPACCVLKSDQNESVITYSNVLTRFFAKRSGPRRNSEMDPFVMVNTRAIFLGPSNPPLSRAANVCNVGRRREPVCQQAARSWSASAAGVDLLPDLMVR